MNIADRIQYLRKTKGMSQEELAQKTGYKSRTSIAKIEKGLVDLPQSKIALFAKALNVDTEVLMGKSADYEFRDAPEKTHLSFDSVEDFKKAYDKSKYRGDRLISAIIDNSEKLTNDGKKSLLDYSNVLLGNPAFSLEAQVNAAHARTDIDMPGDTDTSDNDVMDDENF